MTYTPGPDSLHKFARSDALFDDAEDTRHVLDAHADAWEAERTERLKHTYCAYCGEDFPADDPGTPMAVTEHILTCEKHPLAAFRHDAERLEAANSALREALKRQWECGCGWVNGINLARCAQCGRPPADLSALASRPESET